MDTTGNRKLDARVYSVMKASGFMSFSQAYNVVLRQDELVNEGLMESDLAERRKQKEIEICWRQREEQLSE